MITLGLESLDMITPRFGRISGDFDSLAGNYESKESWEYEDIIGLRSYTHNLSRCEMTNSQCDQLPDGFTAQLVKHRTGIAEVVGLNSVQAGIFSFLSGLYFINT